MSRLVLPLLVLAGCQDYDLQAKDDNPDGMSDSGDTDGPDTGSDDACAPLSADPVDVPTNDACDYAIGGFEPIVEWDIPGARSNSLPVVADLDGDGVPEVVFSKLQGLLSATIEVYHGDGSGRMWSDATPTAYGSAPAVADLDGDGHPEVLAVTDSDGYAIRAMSWDGRFLWESEKFEGDHFNWATGPIVSDMDHDGSPEIVAGKVILNADGTTRGIGGYTSIGCPADAGWLKEGAFPAVADIDLDGVEEVIAGNAIYSPDGDVLHRNGLYPDGAVSVANLDGDPEGEWVSVSWNAIYAFDTDGSLLWGPLSPLNANILSSPAIGDIDGDGEVEILVAGGNELWALNADGTLLWDYPVVDMSGATGASIFDFDADGVPEVVYIDEVQMVALNGADGAEKFWSDEHSSATMYDYPVIADVDADGHAEILVVHDSWSSGMSVYGDRTDSWAPVRGVWNQHAYSITNINDDLSVPTTAVPNFTRYNSYHSALALAPGEFLAADVASEILDVCEKDCDDGELRVLVQVRNTGSATIEAGMSVALYARFDDGDRLLGVTTLADAVPVERSSPGIEFVVDAAEVAGAEALWVAADDDGTGTGALSECLETDNGFQLDGPFCA